MIVLEIVLEGKVAEALAEIAEKMGIGIDMVVVRACQHYIRWTEEHGVRRFVGVGLGMVDDEGSTGD